MSKKWETVIGLEIHAQLKTNAKIFCQDSTSFEGKANSQTSPVSLGLPGALPVPNYNVMKLGAFTGLALNCDVRLDSVFARKHYFYPDLSKGYQISQFDKPICEDGYVEFFLDGEKKRVNIERAHLEEDAGKSSHQGGYSLINFNRCGVALLEIVSKPDMRSAKEAAEYSRAVRAILRYLETCDGNLEEGSMRCDCNVSVRPVGQKEFGTRTELKNINSFRFIEKAIDYEVQRQIDLIESGGEVTQETRLYDSAKNKTFSMRSKEEAQDYRYFPDPDILPIKLDSSFVEELKSMIPELPMQRLERFVDEYKIPVYDSQILTLEREMADYFEVVAKSSNNPKAASNWIMNELAKLMNEEKVELNDIKIKPESLAAMIKFIDDGKISGKMAKTVFSEMWKTGNEPLSIIEEKGLSQITDPDAVKQIVLKVIENSPQQREQYNSGKNKLFGFFVGQVMKESKGQANPEMVNKFLKENL